MAGGAIAAEADNCRSRLLGVSADGMDAGRAACPPYRLKLGNLALGGAF
jgi:hypothetical protein